MQSLCWFCYVAAHFKSIEHDASWNIPTFVDISRPSGPDVKIVLTLDSERYTSNFDIGESLDYVVCNHGVAVKHELHAFRQDMLVSTEA